MAPVGPIRQEGSPISNDQAIPPLRSNSLMGMDLTLIEGPVSA